MTKDDSHFRLRIPADLKERVEVSARENKRSMNAEVVALIELALNNRDALFSGGRDLLDLRRKMDARFLEIDQQAEERRVLLDTAMEELGRTFGQEFLDRVYAKARPLIDKGRVS